jgi:hypothetical protein
MVSFKRPLKKDSCSPHRGQYDANRANVVSSWQFAAHTFVAWDASHDTKRGSALLCFTKPTCSPNVCSSEGRTTSELAARTEQQTKETTDQHLKTVRKHASPQLVKNS